MEQTLSCIRLPLKRINEVSISVPSWRKARMNWAKERGIKRLYLLTTTASKYWRRLGFEAIDRKAAPAGVQGSNEWSSACPTSTTAMVIDL